MKIIPQQAVKVYDNMFPSILHIPEEMGTPRADQMQGTIGEQLSELAGRVCYDSLGKGRDSKSYHDHIKQIGHKSVYEHYNFTVSCPPDVPLQAFINRPGFWIHRDVDGMLLVTTNLRSVIEYAEFETGLFGYDNFVCGALNAVAAYHAPMIMGVNVGDSWVVDPKTPEQRWITFFIIGSRGFSHELVRHGDRTAISQRSTRYVDESEGGVCLHPLLKEETIIRNLMEVEAATYSRLQSVTEDKLLANGADKQTARKQSRGAARGALGNWLATEMIFSASLAQWDRMMRLRMTDAADAEIRLIFNLVYQQLDLQYDCVPATDGIGFVIKGGQK